MKQIGEGKAARCAVMEPEFLGMPSSQCFNLLVLDHTVFQKLQDAVIANDAMGLSTWFIDVSFRVYGSAGVYAEAIVRNMLAFISKMIKRITKVSNGSTGSFDLGIMRFDPDQ